MPIEKNLLDSTFAYLIDASGEYVTVSDATATPLVTPNASLTSMARHVPARSTGATVVALGKTARPRSTRARSMRSRAS
jgi:hypothetical protein